MIYLKNFHLYVSLQSNGYNCYNYSILADIFL